MDISSININNSPKTPGSISKISRTPCRRVGLSRNWKKSGVSSFTPPLSSAKSNREDEQDSETRKRKNCNAEFDEKVEDSSVKSETCYSPKIEINRTPMRILLPRKKFKTPLSAQKCQEEVEKVPQSMLRLSENKAIVNVKLLQQDSTKEVSESTNLITTDENIEDESTKQETKISKLSRKNSKSSNKFKILESPVRNAKELIESVSCYNNKNNLENVKNVLLLNKDNVKGSIKEKSPNNLTKECIVVIQKKIFNTDKYAHHTSKKNLKEIEASHTLFDSDSDDVPLSDLNAKPTHTKSKTANNALELKSQKEANSPIKEKTQDFMQINEVIVEKTEQNVEQNSQNNIIDFTNNDLDDNDFIENKKVNIKKLGKTPKIILKNKTKEKPKTTKLQMKPVPKSSEKSSNLNEEDDDFDYSRSRTILIKKTYDKVPKLSKAKSTGSITQKDLDDITARIESKKNLLLAKAMTNETKELRELIKKWQVGCQTALIELLELMRKKLPDQNMDHSEMLKMLKIPPDLVGYDSDSESFNTPDDAAIILSALNLN